MKFDIQYNIISNFWFIYGVRGVGVRIRLVLREEELGIELPNRFLFTS